MTATISVKSHNLDAAKNFRNKLELIISKSFDFQAKVFL